MNSVVESNSQKDAVIVIHRTFDAPRPIVWRAFTDPKHVAQWYGGVGFTNPVCEMDVRPGGLWHHVMRAPNGSEYAIDFIFIEVVEPERLVWKNAAESRPGGPPKSRTPITLEDLGARTKWSMVARFYSLADRDLSVKMGFREMISQSMERLAAHLTSA